eukprot:CAMPEP_0198283468 /NCGR_PEP_ID=MMETSP1449-20131203/3035_1 /TAXON_ID=420275 /ORGANISM="Attheya septentrionalis, Strain CCMP2084" /LENGTH=411 /DNA_ID=CAMNT_0043980057 /DNA_START=43 /DNA_END=1275 /DNA_ORIENTATION=+
MSAKEQSNRFSASHRSLVAGHAAGTAALLVGHPLDSIKVLVQNSSILTASTHSSSRSISSNATSTGTSTTIQSLSPRRTKAMKPLLARGGGPGMTATSTCTSSSNTTSLLHLQNTSTIQKRYLLTADLAASAVRRSAYAAAASSSSPSTSSSSSTSIGKSSLGKLYNGIGAPLITVGVVQGINFALFDMFRNARLVDPSSSSATSTTGTCNDSLTNVATASFAAGGLVSLITSPLLTLKVRQQIKGWSLREAARQTFSGAGGLRNFYTGYPIHFACDALGRCLFFTTYEALKRWRINSNKSSKSSSNQQESFSRTECVVISATAGMVSSSIVFPLDSIRSRMHGHAVRRRPFIEQTRSSSNKYTMSGGGAWNTARTMWIQGGGVKAFFRGYGITVLRSGPVAAVAMPVYDW